MQVVLIEMTRLARANAVAVWVWDPEVESLQVLASVGLSRGYLDYGNVVAVTPLSKAYAPIYRSYNHGFPAQFVEPRHRDRYPGVFDEWTTQMTFAQIVTFPVVLQTAIVGVVSLYFTRRRPRAEHAWQHSLSFGLFANRVAELLAERLPPEAAPEYAAYLARQERGSHTG